MPFFSSFKKLRFANDNIRSRYFSDDWKTLSLKHVRFYRSLNDTNRALFEKRALLFLETTRIVCMEDELSDLDQLLVAASAIIPVWQFPKWHYFNLQSVMLATGDFNEDFDSDEHDSTISGAVGQGIMAGKMVLSKPALHAGFSQEDNSLQKIDSGRTKKNVGIHEFSHLIDMADGNIDGFPELLVENTFCIPWFELVSDKTIEILEGKSNINPYAAISRVEFLAVVTEYFFERPTMLRKKHPELYKALTVIYKQNTHDIERDIIPRKKEQCPCGSGRRYKKCCLPAS